MNYSIELTRLIYGFRDRDELGPVNFVKTQDVLQAIVYDGRMIDTIIELPVASDYSKARAKLLRQVKMSVGFTIDKITKEVTRTGGAFAR